jgi:ABC-2 type transport system ATP-binding protein
MIEVENLCRRYGSATVLDNVTFNAQAGEVVGLLGPNGAGKTTTMRILTGFMPPTSGRAVINGHDVVTDSMAARASVGYLPERTPLYHDMTVEGCVTFWAELRGVKKPRIAAQEALKKVDLYDRRKSLVRNLSKGMRQRLGLAQALVHNPAVVILDEPTIGIDPAQVIDVRQTVKNLGKEHTVLFSTHILTEAEQVCDRLVILNQGKVAAMGTPEQLRKKLFAGTRLYVQITGLTGEVALKTLQNATGVAKAEVDGAGFAVRAKAGVDARSHIAGAVQRAGGLIIELRPIDLTLEDIFLNLIGAEARGMD